MMAFIPEELNIEFRYMLLDVAAELTRSECKQIAFAEGLPNTLYTSSAKNDDEDLKLLVLHNLEAKGRFDPLNPEGLCHILKKKNRHDVVREVEKYKSGQRFKDAKKLEKNNKKKLSKKQQKGISPTATPKPEEMHELEKLLALARTKTIVLIDKEMKALNNCAKQVEQYRNGDINYNQVKVSFKKFTDVVEKSGRTMQKALSDSSIKSEISTSSAEGTDSPTECTGGEWYSTVTVPAQETVAPTSPESKRRDKPTPLPRTKKPPPQVVPRMRDSTPITAQLETGTTDSPVYDEVDYTDNTGDSGLGSASSDRKDWTRGRDVPMKLFEDPKPSVPEQSYGPSTDNQSYMPLLRKLTPDPVSDGYTVARTCVPPTHT